MSCDVVKVPFYFRYHYLEIISLYNSFYDIPFDFSDDSQHSNVSFAGTSRSTNKEILIGFEGRFKNARLYSIQTSHTTKCLLGNLNEKDDYSRKITPAYVFFKALQGEETLFEANTISTSTR